MALFVDLGIVLLVAGMARSGFKRGFVFYAIDLTGFVGSVLGAVRFHEIPGSVLEAFGAGPRTAGIAGGLAIFVPLIVLTAWVGSKLGRAVYVPGLFTTNRVLGAAFAVALGVTVVVVGMLFARAASLPLGLDGLLERSVIAPWVVEQAAPVISGIDGALGLGLCEGRLEGAVPEMCG